RSTDAPRFHFDRRSHVFNRALENFQRLVAGLITDLPQGIVKSAFGQRALAAPHDPVDELRHQRTVVDRIGKYGSSLCNSASRHRLLRASLWTFGAVLRTALLAIADADGIQRAANHVIANARQILDAPATNQNDRVLLQIVSDAGDIRRD